STYLIAENEPQHTRLVRSPERGGYGLDALWNDDFHHTAAVALTGRKEAYYTDYCGTPQELISAVKYGYLYQGQLYSWQEKRRGMSSLHLPRTAFVSFLQNHDQVANSARGERIHTQTSPGAFRALTALLLLAPATPMLFMGQEFCASMPFLYFADHTPELARAVKKGREEFLAQFPSLASPELAEGFADPAAPETFRRCTLDLAERATHAAAYALHEDLLRLRREDPVFSTQGRDGIDGAVLGAEAFVLRFFAPEEEREDRLLLINLGHDLHLMPAPEPLLAPPDEMRWEVLWSSESPRYGGSGAPPPDDEEKGWLISGRAATVLRPVSREDKA
ncbi:MAG TPA: DUF3459 domain-containing protein, partial [Thermoanaerobaculia bacterium]